MKNEHQRKRKEPTRSRSSVLVAMLYLVSPSSFERNTECSHTIPWAAEAMGGSATTLDAVAAAAVLRRNVISGAAIFTVGDVAAQLLTAPRKPKPKQTREPKQTPKVKVVKVVNNLRTTATTTTTTTTDPPNPPTPTKSKPKEMVIQKQQLPSCSAKSTTTHSKSAAAAAEKEAANSMTTTTTSDIDSDSEDLECSDTEETVTASTAESVSKVEASSTAEASTEASSTAAATVQTKPQPHTTTTNLATLRALFRHQMFSHLDANRLWSAAVLGAIWSGVAVPFLYGKVEERFPGKATLQQVLLKVLVTCSILSTIGNYATMFARRVVSQCLTHQFDTKSSLRFRWIRRPTGSLRLLGAVVKGCVVSCNHDIGEVIADDLKIWPLYDLACYGLIPPAWRPFTTSLMSSGWAMYMSVVSARDSNSDNDNIDDDDDEIEEQVKLTQTNTTQTVTVNAVAPPASVTVLPPPAGAANAAKVVAANTQRLIAVAGGTSCTTTQTNTATMLLPTAAAALEGGSENRGH